MKKIAVALLILVCVLTAEAQQLAFPGAEGFGRHAIGGRGGTIYEVNSLSDSGPGSLRAAVEASGPRIVVFEVSGNIFLQSKLEIRNPYITIAGQTAPGDGIAIVGHQTTVFTHDVIIRYLRFRATDLSGEEVDALNDDYGQYNTMIDHCTASWSVDETLSFYKGEDFTIQWCLVSESLWDSVHSKGEHGYGGIWAGVNASFHHNCFAHHTSRTPRFDRDDTFDHRNNVIYNWGFNSAYGGERCHINIVNNYYKYGPATSTGSGGVKKYRIYQAKDTDTRIYVTGNYVYGYPAVTADNWNGGIQYEGDATEEIIRVFTPFPAADVNTGTAEQAFTDVLAHVGASYPSRDAIDSRIINEIQTGTATYGYTYEGGGNGIIDSQFDLCPNGGLGVCPECSDGDNDYCWLPVLNSTAPPVDTDHDGMPDEWELARGLDPDDAGDGAEDRDGDGYTNVEEYLNWLCSTAAKADLDDDFEVDLEDFAMFAEHWPEISCDEQNNWCGGADLTGDGEVGLDDLREFVANWLAGK